MQRNLDTWVLKTAPSGAKEAPKPVKAAPKAKPSRLGPPRRVLAPSSHNTTTKPDGPAKESTISLEIAKRAKTFVVDAAIASDAGEFRKALQLYREAFSLLDPSALGKGPLAELRRVLRTKISAARHAVVLQNAARALNRHTSEEADAIVEKAKEMVERSFFAILRHATPAELKSLPKVGKVRAQRIVTSRINAEIWAKPETKSILIESCSLSESQATQTWTAFTTSLAEGKISLDLLLYSQKP